MNTPAQNHRKNLPDTILIVDDSEIIRDNLSAIFGSEHNILEASNGEEGLNALRESRGKICAIFLDVNMDVMDGIAMLEIMDAQQIPANIPIFLITGETDRKILRRAYELGVMDVIPKPIEPFMIHRRVSSVIELYLKRLHFGAVVARQTEELTRQNLQLAIMNKGMIEALATATEFRSGESGEHVRRIHDITRLLLTETELGKPYTQQEIEEISNAAILHDVGKISISDTILNKPGRFTDEEFEIMKQHTVNGDKMLTQIPQLKTLPFYEYARIIARHHHERWDGRGYPDHLEGDAIPMCAQVVSIADVYDALVSTRVYKPPFPHDQAVGMICEGKCGTFNPELVKCFMESAPRIENLYKKNGVLAPNEE